MGFLIDYQQEGLQISEVEKERCQMGKGSHKKTVTVRSFAREYSITFFLVRNSIPLLGGEGQQSHDAESNQISLWAIILSQAVV